MRFRPSALALLLVSATASAQGVASPTLELARIQPGAKSRRVSSYDTTGGNGDNVSEIAVLARLLASYDRWWPRAALGGSDPGKPPAPLPVLAFASTQMGPGWVERVRTSATAFGGEPARVRELPRYGHLDILVSRTAARQVFEPVRAWLEGQTLP